MWLEDAFYEPWIGRIVAVGMALTVSGVFWVLMTSPDSPVPPAVGADVAARTAHAFTFWSVVFTLFVRPPLPFFAFASGVVYASLLVVAALSAEATVRYVANGRLFQACPITWGIGAASLPVFVTLGWAAHRSRSDPFAPPRSRHEAGGGRPDSFVQRLSLNPWVVLFGTACSVVGIVFAVVTPRDLWSLISGR